MADLGNTRIFGDLTVSNKLRAYDLARLDNTTVVWEDRTITAGSGLTGGGSLEGNLTLSHADTSSQLSSNNSGRTYIQNIKLDDYGHITSITSATNTDTHVGTVTSIAMTVPTGLSITGSPITSSGTLALSLTSGYSIPTTTKQGQWDTAYSLRHSSGSDNQTISAGNGMNFTSSSGDVSIVMGTPTALTGTTTNAVSTTGHTHSVSLKHSDLGSIGPSDHHTRYSNAEAVAAVNAQTSMSINISGNANSATNITGGLIGSIPYQTAANKTALLPKGTAGYVLTMGTSNIPSWVENSGGTISAGAGMNFTSSNKDVSITMGTPSTISIGTSNSASGITHTHALTLPSTMTPSSHTHGNISNGGAIGTTSGLMIKTTTSGVLTALAAGTTSNYLRGDGVWATPPNNNTTYTAGTGLSLTGTTFSVKYGTSAGTAVQGNDSRLSDARTPTAHTHTFASLTSKPTTVSGFGITDAMTTSHVANGITSTNISNWGTAYTKAHDSGFDNQTISAGAGMNFTSSSGNVTIVMGKPSTLSASTIDGVTTKTHTHAITTTSTGSDSTIVQTDTGGNLTTTNSMKFGVVASIDYNAITKSFDFNFA